MEDISALFPGVPVLSKPFDAGAAHAKHDRQELLCKLQFAVYTVGCHEQPTREAFFL